MDVRPVVALAVACLVVLAGCSAFAGGSAEREEETVTPAPVPDPAVTADSPTPARPPGLWLNGTVEVDALQAAHDAALAGQSYRRTFSYRVTSGGLSSFSGAFTRETLVTPDAFLVREVRAVGGNRSLYVADGEGYRRVDRSGEVTVHRVEKPRDYRSYGPTNTLFRRFLSGVTVDATVVERDGQTYYRLHTSDGDVPEPLTVLGHEVTNYSVTVYVTPEGFVRSLAVGYDRPETPATTHVSVRYSFRLEPDPLSRPDWVPDAASTTTSDAASTTTPEETPTPTPDATSTVTPDRY